MFIIIVLISFYIAYKDITERRIPNISHFFILLTGYCYVFYRPDAIGTSQIIIIPFIVILAGIVLSQFGIIGFGDTKLFFTTMLVIPEDQCINAIYFIVFSGGLWSIIWMFVLSRIGIINRYDKVKKGVPYAIPILLGLCMFTFIGAIG